MRIWESSLFYPGLCNSKFAAFYIFVKTYYFREINNQSEENFSHNNWIDQFIISWNNCHPSFMVKEYGIVET